MGRRAQLDAESVIFVRTVSGYLYPTIATRTSWSVAVVGTLPGIYRRCRHVTIFSGNWRKLRAAALVELACSRLLGGGIHAA